MRRVADVVPLGRLAVAGRGAAVVTHGNSAETDQDGRRPEVTEEEDHFIITRVWRSGRVVEGSGFENRRRATYQGFESLLLRQKKGLLL